MRRRATRSATFVGALFFASMVDGCSYDFDGLVADPNRGGSAGVSATGGSGGAPTDDGGEQPDASMTGGSAGTSGGAAGTGGTAGDGSGGAGGAGNGGKAGGDSGRPDADAGNRGDAVSDARSEGSPVDAAADTSDGAFDCASVSGTVYQGHCYWARTVAANWDGAATGCPAPAHLATITSAGEQTTVAVILSGQDRWIGMRRPLNAPDMESSFYWVTSEPISYRAWDVYSDADKEPNFTGDCVRARFTNFWADSNCSQALSYICEHD